MPSLGVKQQAASPYSILFDEVSVAGKISDFFIEKAEQNKFGMVKACPPPEITGYEGALFLD